MSRILGRINSALGGTPARALGKLDRAFGATPSRGLGRMGSRFAKHGVVAAVAVLFVSVAFAVMVGPVAAQSTINGDADCGIVISSGSGDIDVLKDMSCTGSGAAITITDNNRDLELNGHTISGDGTSGSIGIRLGDGTAPNAVKSVEVEGPGVVTGFDIGIRIHLGEENTIGGEDLDEGVTIVDNNRGIQVIGSDKNLIRNNFVGKVTGSVLIGIHLFGSSSDNDVEHNTVVGHPDTGIQFGGDKNEIRNNFLSDNQVGIHADTTTRAIIDENVLLGGSVGKKGIEVTGASTDAKVTNNVVVDFWTGVQLGQPDSGTCVPLTMTSDASDDAVIKDNVIAGSTDYGVEVGVGEANADYIDNLFYDNSPANTIDC